MTGHDERFRPIETAPNWSSEVFDTCAELTGLLETHAYRFARTMPGAPHSYTHKETWGNDEEFVEALRKMRAVERIEEFFRGHWYRRFCANGYKYWTMGASLDHILVNRAIHALPFDPYAGICDVYDLAIHKTKADVERSQRVYDALEISTWNRHSRHRLRHRIPRRFPLSRTSGRSAMSASIPAGGCSVCSRTSTPNSTAV